MPAACPPSQLGPRWSTRGTFAGLIEKIPYLQQLGITAVELLPVFQFDAQDCPPGKVNYWGYAPVSFFAPHRRTARRDPLGPVDEFRDMVKALHRAGIEVILDVVFNHTAEGDQRSPTLCFRGLDNTAYYILEQDRSRYANYTGTGNTLSANHPIVRRMIVDSLRYWVETMHVDGFRFDLASILTRDASGLRLPSPPVLWDIESDPVLAGTKLIAEAWDAAGLYQVGSFIGDSWKEWNRRFRDDVRDFFRGAPGSVGRIADRLVGSPEIYGHEEREAEQSVNFVTCHDGFTLNDLVSYEHKHNEANGEDNHDGADDNRSWNCGVEGPSDDPEIERLRTRQVKNFLTVTLLSLGMPMILMGDEARRSQSGSNNAYCQDNEISWFDWTLLEKHAEIAPVRKPAKRRAAWKRDAEHEHRRLSLISCSGRRARPGWRQSRAAGLERPFPPSPSRRSTAREGLRVYLIPERVLGAARLRAAAGRRRRRGPVAPMDRYRRSDRRRTSCRGRSRPRGPITPIGRRRIQRSCCSPRSGEGRFLSRLVNHCRLHHLHSSSMRYAGRCICNQGELRARQLDREVPGGKCFRAAWADGRGGRRRDR